MTTNTPKPEWFQLADADNEGALSRRSRITRRGRVVALTAPLLLVATAFGFAQASEQGSTIATQSVASAPVAQTSPASTPDVSQPVSVATHTASQSSLSKPASSTSLGALSAPKVKIAAGSGDDQEGDDEGDDQEGEDD